MAFHVSEQQQQDASTSSDLDLRYYDVLRRLGREFMRRNQAWMPLDEACAEVRIGSEGRDRPRRRIAHLLRRGLLHLEQREIFRDGKWRSRRCIAMRQMCVVVDGWLLTVDPTWEFWAMRRDRRNLSSRASSRRYRQRHDAPRRNNQDLVKTRSESADFIEEIPKVTHLQDLGPAHAAPVVAPPCAAVQQNDPEPVHPAVAPVELKGRQPTSSDRLPQQVRQMPVSPHNGPVPPEPTIQLDLVCGIRPDGRRASRIARRPTESELLAVEAELKELAVDDIDEALAEAGLTPEAQAIMARCWRLNREREQSQGSPPSQNRLSKQTPYATSHPPKSTLLPTAADFIPKALQQPASQQAALAHPEPDSLVRPCPNDPWAKRQGKLPPRSPSTKRRRDVCATHSEVLRLISDGNPDDSWGIKPVSILGLHASYDVLRQAFDITRDAVLAGRTTTPAAYCYATAKKLLTQARRDAAERDTAQHDMA